MNRLVLIGNGFDIAHGLKTSYADFINWYWTEWGKRLASSGNKIEEDDFCSFRMNGIGLGGWYLVRGWYYQDMNLAVDKFANIAKEDTNLCEFKYKSPFFEQINNSVETNGWVDIENEYYTKLVNTYENFYLTLNDQLDFLREKLIEYLKSEEEKGKKQIDEIKEKIYCPIKKREVAVSDQDAFFEGISWGRADFTPSNIMLLNFNYTNTPEMYLADNSTVNYIHGKLDNPQSVIFGYGDELDENYKRLKEQHDIECMRNLKSIRYLEHDNYRRMLEFIESDHFQVVIMGHSCGNSDRTLLNTLFEHRNCVSIKPYYYLKPDGSDNYSELTININRNFTNPKLMRDRVVNKEYCEPLTGVKLGVKVLG